MSQDQIKYVRMRVEETASAACRALQDQNRVHKFASARYAMSCLSNTIIEEGFTSLPSKVQTQIRKAHASCRTLWHTAEREIAAQTIVTQQKVKNVQALKSRTLDALILGVGNLSQILANFQTELANILK
jgi:hypothetical protein